MPSWNCLFRGDRDFLWEVRTLKAPFLHGGGLTISWSVQGGEPLFGGRLLLCLGARRSEGGGAGGQGPRACGSRCAWLSGGTGRLQQRVWCSSLHFSSLESCWRSLSNGCYPAESLRPFRSPMLLFCHSGVCLAGIHTREKLLLQGSYMKSIFIVLCVATFPFKLLFLLSVCRVEWGTKATIISTPKNVKSIT